jgi:hypothetical protein
MTWNTNLFHLIVIGTMPLKGKFTLSKNTLWQYWHQLTHISLYICGIDFCQAEMTLNILRTSRKHPQLSAAAHYHGLIDYNKPAFAPPGCKFISDEKPANRRTWAPHGQHGYSLGPPMHNYRCQNVYISATASERTVDTLEFFPHNSPMSQLSSTDRLIMAANDMTNALKNPHPAVPFAKIGDYTIAALTQLAEI